MDKEHGPVLIGGCPNCEAESAWNLIQRRTWLTLFFIPAIPYSSSWFLRCPACEAATELQRPEVDWAKRLNSVAERPKGMDGYDYKRILQERPFDLSNRPLFRMPHQKSIF